MQLINMDGWYKKYSVIALTLITALNSAWASSPELHEILSAQGMAIANAVLAVLGFIGRFISQTGVDQ